MVSYQSCPWLLIESVVQMPARPHLYVWNPPQLNQPNLESCGFGFAKKSGMPNVTANLWQCHVGENEVSETSGWMDTHQTWGLVQTKGSIWMRRIPSTCQLFWCSTGYETHSFRIDQHQWTGFGNAPHPQATFQRPCLKVLRSPHIIAE